MFRCTVSASSNWFFGSPQKRPKLKYSSVARVSIQNCDWRDGLGLDHWHQTNDDSLLFFSVCFVSVLEIFGTCFGRYFYFRLSSVASQRDSPSEMFIQCFFLDSIHKKKKKTRSQSDAWKKSLTQEINFKVICFIQQCERKKKHLKIKPKDFHFSSKLPRNISGLN